MYFLFFNLILNNQIQFYYLLLTFLNKSKQFIILFYIY